MNRRDVIVGLGAASVVASVPVSIAMAAEPIALDPITYLTCKMTMQMDNPQHRYEARIAFHLPRQDEAYADFDTRYRQMTDAEWAAFRKGVGL